MQVTFVCDKLNVDRGGSNHSLNLLARRLTGRGHDVTVVTMNFVHQNSLPPDPPYRIVTDSVTSDGAVEKAREIYEKLSTHEEGADVLHVFNPAILPIAGLFRRREGSTPMVGRLNTYDVFCTNLSRMDSSCFEHCTVGRKFAHDERDASEKLPSLPRYAFDTHALPRLTNQVDRLFALSPAVAEIYEAIGVERDCISVVPNCLDPEFGANAGIVNPFGESDGRCTVLYVGRLSHEKGVDVLVDALDHLDDPSAYALEIVGDGPLRSTLERDVASRGSSETVRFHGWVDHEALGAYYADADVFVHPGRWPEPFGRTILEAMQSGTPVVTSNVGAPPWIVGDPEMVFERGDSRGLAAVLDRIADTPTSQYTASYPDRLAEFTPETVVSDVEAHYRDLQRRL